MLRHFPLPLTLGIFFGLARVILTEPACEDLDSGIQPKADVLMQVVKKEGKHSGQGFAAASKSQEHLSEDSAHNANNALEVIPSEADLNGRQSEPNTTEANTTVCVTHEDPLAKSPGYTVSPPGTPCVFGIDERDEGSHCIMDEDYGPFGWCWTSTYKNAFGSCSESCPLSGLAKKLGDRIDELDTLVGKVVKALEEERTEKVNESLAMNNESVANASSLDNTTAEVQEEALEDPLNPSAEGVLLDWD
mmetsp:Transcript_102537/g.306323  ORF Transcript_102537/g.306323 Transcript_102537/m.306323 type:complete len:248 (+) Transcript_102537:110-853(+)